MRGLTVILVLAAGCASGGLVRASRGAGSVRFDFDDRGKGVQVMGVSVYEVDEAGYRRRALCDLERSSPASDMASLTNWVYGQTVSANYAVVGCAPLNVGHLYGVTVYQPGHCISHTTFTLASDGSVQDLGPNRIGCLM
jgi:hypothetical protein